MYQSNSNQRANPFAPMSPQQDVRMATPGRNPYGFGAQRVAGQLAPQRAAQGYQSNTGMQARMPNFIQQPQPTPQRPGGMLGYGNGPAPGAADFGSLMQKGGTMPINPETGQPLLPGQTMVDWSNPVIRNDVNGPAIATDPTTMLGSRGIDYAAILRQLGYGR